MSLRKRLQKGATEGNWYDPAHRLGVTPFAYPVGTGARLGDATFEANPTKGTLVAPARRVSLCKPHNAPLAGRCLSTWQRSSGGAVNQILVLGSLDRGYGYSERSSLERSRTEGARPRP